MDASLLDLVVIQRERGLRAELLQNGECEYLEYRGLDNPDLYRFSTNRSWASQSPTVLAYI